MNLQVELPHAAMNLLIRRSSWATGVQGLRASGLYRFRGLIFGGGLWGLGSRDLGFRGFGGAAFRCGLGEFG